MLKLVTMVCPRPFARQQCQVAIFLTFLLLSKNIPIDLIQLKCNHQYDVKLSIIQEVP